MYVVELAPEPLDFTTPKAVESASLASEYITLNGTGSPAAYQDYFTYYSNLKVVFYDQLQTQYDELNTAILTKIDADYDTTDDIDPEVKQRWYPICLSLFYDPVYDPAHQFVSSIGRLKYLSPIYQSLEDSGQHELGVQWLDENRAFYAPITVTGIEKILGIDTTEKVFLN